MILFTSDLDRTLIYSKKMMETYPGQEALPAVPVEHNRGEIITFMSDKSINLLKEFHEKHLFVPVTTRAFYQYERIRIFQDEIKPKFAICNNGGTILIDGKVDSEWEKIILGRLATTALPKQDILKEFAKIRHQDWVEKEFLVDDFFYVFHVNKDRVPHAELAGFETELQKLGWKTFLHGRKLYILPISLEKAFAVRQLKTYLDYDLHIAAGDSLMDYKMIAEADIGYSPLHGELFEFKGNDASAKVTWLTQNGAASTEELLTNILKKQNTSKTR